MPVAFQNNAQMGLFLMKSMVIVTSSNLDV